MSGTQQNLDIPLKQPKYSIDTSAILEGYNRYYPPDVFPTLWGKIELLIKNGELKATAMVLEELKQKDDDVRNWAKQQEKDLFVPVDENIQKIVSEIMKNYPRIVAESKQNKKNNADPFVIALAKQNDVTAISAEEGSSEKKPKIPFICENFEIKHITFLEFIRTEKWSF